MYGERNLATTTWLRLLRVAQKISHAGAEHITCRGLSGPGLDMLAQIAADEGVTQQELAERLLVTKGSVSQLVARLTQQHLIEKRQEGHANHLYLSEKGRAVLQQIMPQHDAFIGERMAHLSAEELRQLNDLLRKLDKRLG